jgi:hypothetical protein
VGEVGARWSCSGNVAFKIKGAANVTIRDLTITALEEAIELDSADGASCTLAGVTITGCAVAGIKAHGADSSLIVDRSLIAGNGGVAVLLEDSAEVTMRNTFVVGNGFEGVDTGGIWVKAAGVRLTATNCTIADNVAKTAVAGGIHNIVSGDKITLKNLIFANNSPNGLDEQCELCSLGGDSYEGDDDGVFVKAAAERFVVEDYKIADRSPARNIGLTDLGILIDYWGQSRDPADGGIDAGADELDLAHGVCRPPPL